MNENTLFINQKHVPKLGSSYKRYVSNNGVLKEFKLGALANILIPKEDIWFKLSDLPKYMQKNLQEKALTIEEIRYMINKNERKQEFYDSEGVKVYVTENTELMPVVGKFLPQDGVLPYTVVEKNNQITLEALLIGLNWHWSDLFVGNTEFGNNVFCLASDLTKEQQDYFKDEIIMLKDALDYLENNNIKKLS